ncbi:hypothetical protein MKX03_029106 [Papaver bracteatum]|nr:hypothetical protein MKX03_029106 [Papaver bracteatum]
MLLLAFRHLRGLYRKLVEWWRVNNLHGPVPKTTVITTSFSYGLLIAFGHIRDLVRNLIEWWTSSNDLHGYAPICINDFFTRRLCRHVQDCFNRPIASAPNSWNELVERYSNDHNKTLKCSTSTLRCLNLGSYNYLGFAASDEYCTPRVIKSLKKFSATISSARVDGGTTTLHAELEECVASFVGKDAAMVNGNGGLIISDSLNHNSIVNGSRVSGALVQAFQHNSPSHLEKVLREAIAEGEGNADEGIYIMKVDLCILPEIIAVCKKYKAYTYLDEAYNIGAVGKSGRGVCEFLGVNTADVDIMMGIFSKSFGSCGGYIAASKEVIEYLKLTCPVHLYATTISPPAAQQILSSIKVILGNDGSSRAAQKLARIRENRNFFRSKLQKMGFQVIGGNDSPIMPIMNVAVVAVGYPAIKQLMLARVRICISTSHTREDLFTALEVISQVGDLIGIKYFHAERAKEASMQRKIEDR